MTWNFSMAEAPRDRKILAAVDGEVRMVRYGKTSHVPIEGFCLADQGPEDFDLCRPTAWCELPLHPHHMPPADLLPVSADAIPIIEDVGSGQ